jgi:hypothetical protein
MSATRTLSMERQRYRKATSGECPAPSSQGWPGSSAASRDWSRRQHRRACLQVRTQRIEIQLEPALPVRPDPSPPPLSRAKHAHERLTFPERLARNARTPGACRVTITLFGIPERFATSLGLETA